MEQRNNEIIVANFTNKLFFFFISKWLKNVNLNRDGLLSKDELFCFTVTCVSGYSPTYF